MTATILGLGSRKTMARSRQLDFFGGDEQPELFDAEAAPEAYSADPDEVRAELHRILAEARAARTLPWDRRRTLLYRTIFPQMANWLPDDEAAQLRFDFAAELARLDAA